MMKFQITSVVLFSVLASLAIASHPHEAICIVNQNEKGKTAPLLVQTHIERTYQVGDANNDPHIYRYQMRTCSDAAGKETCTTYATQKDVFSPNIDLKFVSMANLNDSLFDGKIILQSIETSRTVDPDLRHTLLGQHFVNVTMKNVSRISGFIAQGNVRVPLEASLTQCIYQSWLPLVDESYTSKSNDNICLVDGDYPPGNDATRLQFVLQSQANEEGTLYQVRVCDDDNELYDNSPTCTTYQSARVKDPNSPIKLVGMKDAGKVFFEGKISANSMVGNFVQSYWNTAISSAVRQRKLIPMSFKVDKCIHQRAVKMNAEDGSFVY